MTDESALTHVDESGAATMVDVAGKEVTARTATASGRLCTTAEVVSALCAENLPKGDAVAVSRLAGIMGAKRTSDLIPLCHPIALHKVEVELEFNSNTVDINVMTKTADRTGIEMEALTAVSITGLTLIDMVKAVDPAAYLTDIRVESKTGGKTGSWRRV